MRRIARWTDLPEPSRPLVEAFVAKRLLVKDERDNEIVVEVALESLLRQWADRRRGWQTKPGSQGRRRPRTQRSGLGGLGPKTRPGCLSANG